MTNSKPATPVLAALGAFLRAGFAPATPLQKAIATALLVKLVVVIAMRAFLFSGDLRIPVNDGVLETRLVGPVSHGSPQP